MTYKVIRGRDQLRIEAADLARKVGRDQRRRLSQVPQDCGVDRQLVDVGGNASIYSEPEWWHERR